MTYERWEQVRELVRSKFDIANQGTENLDPGPGEVEFLEFKSPAGSIRLELEMRPRVAEKKTYYSKRMGSASTVEYRYDPSTVVLHFKVLRFNDVNGQWESLEADNLMSSLI